jgi:hypothetical protein
LFRLLCNINISSNNIIATDYNKQVAPGRA